MIVKAFIFVMSVSCTWSSCQAMNVIGVQLLEMEDLVQMNATTTTGNLAYGDECRNIGGRSILEDVCFMSNYMYQCINGKCQCIYVRIYTQNKVDKVEQMVFQNGTCRRLLGWECTTIAHCSEGLTCISMKDGAGRNTHNSSQIEEDFIPDGQNLLSNPYRARIKMRIKEMFPPLTSTTTTKPGQNDKAQDPGPNDPVEKQFMKAIQLDDDYVYESPDFVSAEKLRHMKEKNIEGLKKYCAKDAALRLTLDKMTMLVLLISLLHKPVIFTGYIM